MSKKVAVIGAGPCGLVALKELREAGVEATIYESSGVVGGVFAHPLPCFNLTISNYFMAFSDFPPTGDYEYSTMVEYLNYVKGYASNFKLEEHIKFNTTVSTAELTKENKWKLVLLKSAGKESSTTETVIVDALVIATGCHREPRIPDLGDFKGDVIHSSRRRYPVIHSRTGCN